MRTYFYHSLFIAVALLTNIASNAQSAKVSGDVKADGQPVPFASIGFKGSSISGISDSLGNFTIEGLPANTRTMTVSAVGFLAVNKNFTLHDGAAVVSVVLEKAGTSMEDVVVTGTLKEVKRMESPVPVEVYTPAFFKKNPTPNIFDALQNVNGVRPQLNCNICNTGDIHINGLEGPYTMVLIDGMPIVSSLSTVYGLSGIPNSLVERIEIVKGPASSLYGSEAVGGLINIITKNPSNAPKLSADFFSTSWGEYNLDLGIKNKLGKNLDVLTGINYFNYQNIKDRNNDFFTDVTLQQRISVFQKWSLKRKYNRPFTIAGRFFYEDRWGGETNWDKQFRGGDSVYGESIYTKRIELLSTYQLPVKEKILLSVSFNDHDQDSRYGTTSYIARQKIAFAQLTWDKKIGRNDLLFGSAIRYTFYDDNTPSTASFNLQNAPQRTWLPGVFVQDELKFTDKHTILLGARYDYNSIHGNIFTPRFAYKLKLNENNIIRLNAGTGFRVVNLFTEDHAALTGARTVEVKSELKPEKTYNVNLNYLKKIYSTKGFIVNLDIAAWYTYFNNRITADYETDPNKIIYDNLNGYAESKGLSTNIDISFMNGLKILTGATFQHVANVEAGIKTRQILTERFTGTWSVSYKIKPLKLAVDYTGNIYGPMRLPLLGPLDPRKANSPVWSIQNIQFLYSGFRKFELYAGIKNLLNWTPAKKNPFLIARSNDPFDMDVTYGSNGQVEATASNPYALSFDPNYVYAPNQGMRIFAGIRVTIK